MNDTLKQFTECYYQQDESYWQTMSSEQNWYEVLNYYQINYERYKWDIEHYMYLIEKYIEYGLHKKIFLKGLKDRCIISSTNPFAGNTRLNKVEIYNAYCDKDYNVVFMYDYSKVKERREFRKEDNKEIIKHTLSWINNRV